MNDARKIGTVDNSNSKRNPLSHAEGILMNPQIKQRLIAAGLIIVLVALPCVWFMREYRQVKLDQALIAAIRRSDDHAFDALLAKGASSNSRTRYGANALSYAVVAGNGYQVKALIEAGADVNARQYLGHTVLKYANEHKYTEIASMLRAAGAKE